MDQQSAKYEAIVMGVSTGGMDALKTILQKLPPSLSVPVIVVQHRAKDEKDLLEELLQSHCKIRIKQADEKEKIKPGRVYLAPPNYHLLVERDRTFSLSIDELCNYSRPSIDVLFETASEAFGKKLIGIILTGANRDGAGGLAKIANAGGMTIAQNPKTAYFGEMPQAAIQTGKVKNVLDLDQISGFLMKLFNEKSDD